MKDYQPLFSNDGLSTQVRWEKLECFIKDWYDIDIPKKDFQQEIVEIEHELNIPLPQSAKHFLNFSKRLESINYTYPNGCKSNMFTKTLRDCIDIKIYEDFDVLSLIIQAEEDIFWGIRKADFHKENPEVLCFILDYDTDKFEAYPEGNYPNVTAFILNHLILYLGNCNSFNIPTENVEKFKKISEQFFSQYKTYDGLKISETENIFILQSKFCGDIFIIFNIRISITLDSLPKEIIYFLKNTHIPFAKFIDSKTHSLWS